MDDDDVSRAVLDKLRDLLGLKAAADEPLLLVAAARVEQVAEVVAGIETHVISSE